MPGPLPKTVVFITGAFIGNNCWDEWRLYFENKGYKTLVPPWPHKEGSPEELRHRHPDAAIASNRLADLVKYFEAIVHALPERPVLIGHSLGGLIVQLLLQRGLGSAGVALRSFPPAVVSKYMVPIIGKWWEALGFFTPVRDSYLISFTKWRNTVANGMTCEQQKQSYYEYAIPESKLVLRDAFTAVARIDFKNPHAPLLLTSGSHDRIIPASLNYRNFKKYETPGSVTEYMNFKDRNHLIFGDSEWMEEADFILYWLTFYYD